MTSRVVLRALAIASVCLAAVGCQSEGSEWSKHFNDSALKPPSSAVEERFGNGPVEITLLLPRGSTGIYDEPTRDVRDGAALAAAELGDALVTVRVVDVSGGPQAAKDAAEAAAARNSSLLLSYAGPETTGAIASIPAADRPPIINLSSTVTGENLFNFNSDDVEAAATVVGGLASADKTSIVVLAPSDFSAEQEQRLTGKVQQAGGRASQILRYAADGKDIGDTVASRADLIKKAGAVLILGRTTAVNDVIAAVKKLNANAPILGTEGWPRSAILNPAANGALLAASEQEGASLIAERYQRHKGRGLTPNAARAYDSIAIGSGLVRAGGAEAIKASALSNPTGFRGVSGVFRFTADGRTQRQFGLYRIESAKLVPVQAASASF